MLECCRKVWTSALCMLEPRSVGEYGPVLLHGNILKEIADITETLTFLKSKFPLLRDQIGLFTGLAIFRKKSSDPLDPVLSLSA